MNWVAKWNSFCDCIFVPKRGVTLTIYHVLLEWTLKTIHALWGVFVCFYANIHAILEPWIHKGYTVVKVGGGIDPATEVTHFGLNVCDLWPVQPTNDWVGHVLSNSRPHLLYWGDWEMGTAISCTKCSQVAGMWSTVGNPSITDIFGKQHFAPYS